MIWIAPAVVVVASVLVALVLVGWSIMELVYGEQRAASLTKGIVSLLVWVPFSYVAIYVSLVVSVHGGGPTGDGVTDRTFLGHILVIGSSLVYAAVGYGLVVLVCRQTGKKQDGT